MSPSKPDFWQRWFPSFFRGRPKSVSFPQWNPPQKSSAEIMKEHAENRLRAQKEMLCRVADSPRQQNLVLRGSLLMKLWFENARDPEDVDWVVTPDTLKANDEDGQAIIQSVIEAIRQSHPADNVDRNTRVRMQPIGAYYPTPGVRLGVSWNSGQRVNGLQMDFAFEDKLLEKPVQATFNVEGIPVTILTASPPQSLASKLRWLASDNKPRTKDLYDAWLLASRTQLSMELLRKTFDAANLQWPRKQWPELLQSLELWPISLLVNGTWHAGGVDQIARWKEELAKSLAKSLAN